MLARMHLLYSKSNTKKKKGTNSREEWLCLWGLINVQGSSCVHNPNSIYMCKTGAKYVVTIVTSKRQIIFYGSFDLSLIVLWPKELPRSITMKNHRKVKRMSQQTFFIDDYQSMLSHLWVLSIVFFVFAVLWLS